MEYLSDHHLQSLLTKEWLVKIDNDQSIPYLIKFHASAADLSCCLMITDTRTVWGEALSSKTFARRWRDCNPSTSPPFTSASEEDEWREQILDLLSAMHTIGGISDLSFEVVDSENADLAFELGSGDFKWRWETYSLGPKVSADTISKQLIMPLISVSHLAFSSSDPVNEVSESNLEKVVDKTGRAGRRTLDNHVKNTISRPRLATTLRRVSALFSFLPDLPPIVSKVEPPELKIPAIRSKLPLPATTPLKEESRRLLSPGPSTKLLVTHTLPDQLAVEAQPRALTQALEDDSATEEEEDEAQPAKLTGTGIASGRSVRTTSPRPQQVVDRVQSRQPSPWAATPEKASRKEPEPSSESMSSSPVRPSKKSKRPRTPSSEDESDSEADRRRQLAQIKRGSARGPKQPIKRGGKRF